MLMLEAPINRDEDVKLLFNQSQQDLILQPVPAKFKSRPNVVTSEDAGCPRINTGA